MSVTIYLGDVGQGMDGAAQVEGGSDGEEETKVRRRLWQVAANR